MPSRKLHLLGNGVDLMRFRPRPDKAETARRSLGVGADKVVAGVVGRLVWEKGFAELFEAARRLRHTRPEVVVVVVGPTDPAKSASLTEADLDRAHTEAGVVFLGEHREVEALYPGFDLFVLASHREGSRARPWRQPPAACRSSRRISGGADKSSTTEAPACWSLSATRWRWRMPSGPLPRMRRGGGPWDRPLVSAPSRSSTTAG